MAHPECYTRTIQDTLMRARVEAYTLSLRPNQPPVVIHRTLFRGVQARLGEKRFRESHP